MPFLRRLLDSDKVILGLILFAVYVCGGVIIFPGWYYSTIRSGGFPLLLHEAQTTFMPINLLAVGFIGCFLFIVTYLEHFHLSLYQRLQGLLPSRFLALLAGVVFVTSLFRFFSYSSELTKLDILAEKVEALQEKTAPSKLVTPPIDVIYINETKLLSIYSQIASSLQLKEKSIARKSTHSAKGETGVEGVATIGGEMGSEKEEKEKYNARQIDISETLILVINDLSDKVKTIQPIVLEIDELKNLDGAVQLLKQHDLDIAEPNKLERVKKQLKSKGVKERMEKRAFESNTWVLISGPVSVTSVGNAYYVVFDYISGEKEAVQFSCQVPSTNGLFSDMSQTGQGAPLKLNVFGIINRAATAEETGKIDFQMNCVGIYR